MGTLIIPTNNSSGSHSHSSGTFGSSSSVYQNPYAGDLPKINGQSPNLQPLAPKTSTSSSTSSTAKVVKDLGNAIKSVTAAVPTGDSSAKTVSNTKSSNADLDMALWDTSPSGSSGGSESFNYVSPTYTDISTADYTSPYDVASLISSSAASNSAQSQEFAREQMRWQEEQNAKAMAFNQSEAKLNRDWQEMMSNTAHQREVADMIKAGINPVLSVQGGNGATVTSGATASGVTSAGAKGDVDTGFTSALASMFSTLIGALTSQSIANISADSAKTVAGINASTAKTVEKMREANDVYIHENYPSNAWQAAGTQGIYDFVRGLFK